MNEEVVKNVTKNMASLDPSHQLWFIFSLGGLLIFAALALPLIKKYRNALQVNGTHAIQDTHLEKRMDRLEENQSKLFEENKEINKLLIKLDTKMNIILEYNYQNKHSPGR